jgi:hypothetical protein
MKGITYEGTVKDGQIKLPETVRLPEHAKVLIAVQEANEPEPVAIEVGDDGLPVIRTRSGVITSRLVKSLDAYCL